MLAVACAIGLLSTPAHAIFGFGFHGGMDFVSIDKSDGFSQQDFADAAAKLDMAGFDSSPWAFINMTREAVSNPIIGGFHVYVDAIPILDIEVSGDIAYQKYQVAYRSTVSGGVEEVYDAPFVRGGIYATVRRDLIEFPPGLPLVAFYLGGGLGAHFVSQMAGPELVVKAIGEGNPNTTKPNIKDTIERNASLGYHALVGLRVKPPIIPLAFRLEGKYTITGQEDFERPNGVMTAYLGFDFAF